MYSVHEMDKKDRAAVAQDCSIVAIKQLPPEKKMLLRHTLNYEEDP